MTQIRPLPKIPTSRAAFIVLAFVGFTAVIVWLATRFGSALWPIVLLAVVFVASLFYWNRRRCPECGGRLKLRRDYFKTNTQYRCFLDCHRCEIAWDSGVVSDDSDAGSSV
jgi:hypothetical protein